VHCSRRHVCAFAEFRDVEIGHGDVISVGRVTVKAWQCLISACHKTEKEGYANREMGLMLLIVPPATYERTFLLCLAIDAHVRIPLEGTQPREWCITA
jgi:hypothetical protein